MAHFDELRVAHPNASETELELRHQIDHLTWALDAARRALMDRELIVSGLEGPSQLMDLHNASYRKR